MESALRRAFPDEIEIFNASNDESIRPGADWWKDIERGLNDCELMLVIATPDSVQRRWINFESGAVWLSGQPVVPCLARGMTASGLPTPLSHFQAVDIASEKDLSRLIQMVSDGKLSVSKDFDPKAMADSFAQLWSTKREQVGSNVNTAEQQRRKNLLAKLRQLYILSNDGISLRMLAGLEPLPREWTEQQLAKLGETWRQDAYL